MDWPPGAAAGLVRSPIGFHDASQVAGTPLFDADRFLIKFHNLWTIEAPAGYSLLFTHPANRFDLPFTTLTGLVDCDRYHDIPDPFPGALARRRTSAACCPGARRSRNACRSSGRAWAARTAAFTDEDDAASARSCAARSPARRASIGGGSGPEAVSRVNGPGTSQRRSGAGRSGRATPRRGR